MLRYLYILTIFLGLLSLSGQLNVSGKKIFTLQETISKASLLEKEYWNNLFEEKYDNHGEQCKGIFSCKTILFSDLQKYFFIKTVSFIKSSFMPPNSAVSMGFITVWTIPKIS
ncbi:hypothetical protein CMU00_17325 [Elizabethkingia anophelis]|nr:hypothetical protein [Elizabethkingia anophelis]